MVSRDHADAVHKQFVDDVSCVFRCVHSADAMSAEIRAKSSDIGLFNCRVNFVSGDTPLFHPVQRVAGEFDAMIA